MELPNRSSKCTWSRNAGDSPHTQRKPEKGKTLPSILHAIGNTPMVRLNNIPKAHGIKCEIFAKCEFLNPGGSVKDRIGYRMVLDAEQKGLLKPGSTIIEPTSGNTGIGLAMAAAVKGYRCIIVMPEKMSNEKVYALKALGAEIVRTPTEAAWDSEEGHISVSQKLRSEIPNSVILDQYTNPGNPLAHYDQTATEIFEQCDGRIDYLVIGAGTGGTISGIARKFKELSPATKIVGVDPEGSILADTKESDEIAKRVKFYDVEGIGYDFIPTVLDRSVIDSWVKSNDRDSFAAVREVIKLEGLLCGGSSGSALACTLELAKTLPADKRVVTLLPDGIRNYMTKFVSDQWMESRGFLDPPKPIEANKWWWNLHVSSLNPTYSSEHTIYSDSQTNPVTMLSLIEMSSTDRFPVIDMNNRFKGVVSSHMLRNNLIAGTCLPSDLAVNFIDRKSVKVSLVTTLGRVSRIMETEPFVVVVDDLNSEIFVGIVTQQTLMRFIDAGERSNSNGDA